MYFCRVLKRSCDVYMGFAEKCNENVMKREGVCSW